MSKSPKNQLQFNVPIECKGDEGDIVEGTENDGALAIRRGETITSVGRINKKESYNSPSVSEEFDGMKGRKLEINSTNNTVTEARPTRSYTSFYKSSK